MIKHIFYVALVVSILALTSCVGGLTNLDAEWGKDNVELQNKLGLKTYEGIAKEKAMNAMAVALQRLDLIVANADFTMGFMMATAQAPKPLNYDEFEFVKKSEISRARSHVPLFTWSALRDFDSRFNISFLETGGGVQISLRAKLEFKGSRSSFVPITEFPPKALEIAYPKIWNEFEKIAFIQSKTLKE
jgi:hypothetical protein